MYIKQIKKHQKKVVDQKTQEELNRPKTSRNRIFEHEDFIEEIIKKLENNEIDPYAPRSLLNLEVYNKLSEQDEGRVDLAARNICSILHSVQDLWVQDHSRSTVMVDLIQTIKASKERVENELGDVFII